VLFVVFVFCCKEYQQTRERKTGQNFLRRPKERAMIKLDFATEKREERKKKGNTRRGKF
jgi:hypothetical protein